MYRIFLYAWQENLMCHLIWDLDGTLIDSSRDIMVCLELAVKNSDLELSRKTAPFVIGPTVDVILKKAFPPECLTDNVLKKVISNFRMIYDNSEFEMTKSFPDIEKIIKNNWLFMHHIITNKPDMATKRILKKLGWAAYIATVNTPYTEIIATGRKQLKTKKELFLDLIAKCNKRSHFIGIGDMREDCIAAKENNIGAIGVLWGTGTREELFDCCDYLFDTTKKLCDFLHGIAK
jgi:phosphoglycolate phosphatase